MLIMGCLSSTLPGDESISNCKLLRIIAPASLRSRLLQYLIMSGAVGLLAEITLDQVGSCGLSSSPSSTLTSNRSGVSHTQVKRSLIHSYLFNVNL